MRKLGAPLDFVQNEARNLRLHVLAAAPGSPVSGQSYYDSVLLVARFWNGSAWIDMAGGTPADATTGSKGIIQLAGDLAGTAALPTLSASKDAEVKARANHTGTQLAATISDFDTQVRTSRLDQLAVPTADVSFNSRKITSLANGSGANDAVNKGQLDAAILGVRKASVRAATTANGALATAYENGDTLDTVTLATGDRILLKNQTAPAENGIYTVNASGAPTRAADMDAASEVDGTLVIVEDGTLAGTLWSTTSEVTTLNTDSIVFNQFNSAADIVAGAGLTKTGTTLDIVGTASRISVAADSIDIDSGYVGQASITTVGTIATGTWSATTIAVAKGGTGQTTAKAARETGLGAAGVYNSETHGAGTTITVSAATHGLRGIRGIVPHTYDVSSGDSRLDDCNVASNGDVVITFSASQSANTIGVTLIG